MIKICHLSSVHQPRDSRIFVKQCRSLAAAGYEVILVVPCEKSEVVDGVKFVPFRQINNRYIRILFSPFHMFWLALKQKASLYHFHDPELLPVGLCLRLLGKKVIYDVHEDVPKQVMEKTYLKPHALQRFVALCVKTLEQFGARVFSRVVTATPDIASNFPPENTTVVRNVPVLSFINTSVVTDLQKTKPVVIYGGVLSHERGLIEIVQAMEYVKDRAELWLAGIWAKERLREECEAEAGWQHVRMLGMMSQAEFYTIMKMADIGIVNFLPIPNHVCALPNKLFEYMALSLPMVLSNFPYWRENFEACALFADPNDPEEIAARILEYLDNPELRQEKGRNGLALIESGFSWENEENVLIDLYNTLFRIASPKDTD